MNTYEGVDPSNLTPLEKQHFLALDRFVEHEALLSTAQIVQKRMGEAAPAIAMPPIGTWVLDSDEDSDDGANNAPGPGTYTAQHTPLPGALPRESPLPLLGRPNSYMLRPDSYAPPQRSTVRSASPSLVPDQGRRRGRTSPSLVKTVNAIEREARVHRLPPGARRSPAVRPYPDSLPPPSSLSRLLDESANGGGVELVERRLSFSADGALDTGAMDGPITLDDLANSDSRTDTPSRGRRSPASGSRSRSRSRTASRTSSRARSHSTSRVLKANSTSLRKILSRARRSRRPAHAPRALTALSLRSSPALLEPGSTTRATSQLAMTLGSPARPAASNRSTRDPLSTPVSQSARPASRSTLLESPLPPLPSSLNHLVTPEAHREPEPRVAQLPSSSAAAAAAAQDTPLGYFPLTFFDDATFDELNEKLALPSSAISGMSKWFDVDGSWSWQPCLVVEYNAERAQYLIEWLSNHSLKWVSRLNLVFDGEDMALFGQRLQAALVARREAEAVLRYNVRIDLMPTDGLPELTDASYANIVTRVGRNFPHAQSLTTRQHAIAAAAALASTQAAARSGAPAAANPAVQFTPTVEGTPFTDAFEESVRHHYKRTINQMEFDATIPYRPINPEEPLPAPPLPAPVPALATLQLPPYDFHAAAAAFADAHFLARPKLAAALRAAWSFMARLPTRPLLLAYLVKPASRKPSKDIPLLTLVDFQNDEMFHMRNIVRDIRYVTLTSLNHTVDAGLTAHAADAPADLIPRLPLIRLLNYMVRDAVADLLRNSLDSFAATFTEYLDELDRLVKAVANNLALARAAADGTQSEDDDDYDDDDDDDNRTDLDADPDAAPNSGALVSASASGSNISKAEKAERHKARAKAKAARAEDKALTDLIASHAHSAVASPDQDDVDDPSAGSVTTAATAATNATPAATNATPAATNATPAATNATPAATKRTKSTTTTKTAKTAAAKTAAAAAASAGPPPAPEFALFAAPGAYLPRKTPLFKVVLEADTTDKTTRFVYTPSIDDIRSVCHHLVNETLVALQDLPTVQVDEFHPEPVPPVFDPQASVASPDIARARALVDKVLDTSEGFLRGYASRFEPYGRLLAVSHSEYAAAFVATNPKPVQFANEIADISRLADEIHHAVDDSVIMGMVAVDVAALKAELLLAAARIRRALLKALRTDTLEFCAALNDRYTAIEAKLCTVPETPEELTILNKFIAALPKEKRKLGRRAAELTARFDLLASFGYEVPDAVVDAHYAVLAWPRSLDTTMVETERHLGHARVNMTRETKQKLADLESRAIDASVAVRDFDFADDLDSAEELGEKAAALRATLKDLGTELALYNKHELLFGVEPTPIHVLEETLAEFKPLHTLWTNAAAWFTAQGSWLGQSFVSLSASAMEKFILKTYKTNSKVLRALRGTHIAGATAATALKDSIEAFKARMPIIKKLRHPGIRRRHWVQLNEETGLSIPPQADWNLYYFVELHLENHTDVVTAVADNAINEYNLESSLEKMMSGLKRESFAVLPYKDSDTFIIGSPDDLVTLLDDYTVNLATMLSSPFIGPLEAATRKFATKIKLIQATIDAWLLVQRSWMYLNPIFSSEDINRALPRGAMLYEAVDSSWRRTMKKVSRHPAVLAVCDGTDVLDVLNECHELLEQIMELLQNYLDVKRSVFPRFYFLSNDELLDILAKSTDPTRVQPYLRKCFENIATLTMEPAGVSRVGKPLVNITAMNSAEGESVAFPDPIGTTHDVEHWLLDVEGAMRISLAGLVADALLDHESAKREAWVLAWPGQIVLAVNQLVFTTLVSTCLHNRDLRGLKILHAKLVDQLNRLTELVSSPLSRLQSLTLGALFVMDVHNRDTVRELITNKVTSESDFRWQAQMRFYMEGAGDAARLVVRMVLATLDYGYEYLGNTSRLVITPLTDRCYRTLMSALHLHLGGAPAGPAGTGKTETCKDLAKAVAKQCVVFNCSEALDYMQMGKFFKGLASAGAWACFDEFNRIEIEVLSVIASQILAIQRSVAAGVKQFMFEGTIIDLNPTCTVFITMNPGYAGRTELPNNLKALFRPVAMMKADYAFIGEILLYSEGFKSAPSLSRKMVNGFKLAAEQLSSQDHYDFGMRTIKAVLSTAGGLMRAARAAQDSSHVPIDESLLLYRALADCNVPKLIADDIPLFKGILSDLFPAAVLPTPDYGNLNTAIVQAASAANLQPGNEFVTKVTQYYETLQVRHGVMIVGAAGTGKTSIRNSLASALHTVGDPVVAHVINPKSITMGELYGEVNDVTLEWTDGILSHIVRDIVEDLADNPDGDLRWIVFDGPVDSLWIESMNTVLDDNKLLCLPNSERIKIPPRVSFVFEVRDLAQASPATVSRCGMVFVNKSTVSWRAWADSYLATWDAHTTNVFGHVLAHVFDAVLVPALDLALAPGASVAPVTLAGLLRSFFTLLDILLPIVVPPEPKNSPDGSDGHGGDDRSDGVSSNAGSDDDDDDSNNDDDDDDDILDDDNDELDEMALAAARLASADQAKREFLVPIGDTLSNAEVASAFEGLVLFALTWSVGTLLGPEPRAAFDTLVRDALARRLPPGSSAPSPPLAKTMHPLPQEGTVFDYAFRLVLGDVGWRPWAADPELESQAVSPDVPLSSVFVPTVETVSLGFVTELLVRANSPVLLLGSSGSGKTAGLRDLLLGRLDARFIPTFMGFSATVNAHVVRELLASKVDRRRKGVFGPMLGKSLVVFVDDINMPTPEKYGARPPIQLLRQIADQGGWYDSASLDKQFVSLVDVQFVCALTLGAGKAPITQRLARHFNALHAVEYERDSLESIFAAILRAHTAKFLSDIRSLSPAIISATFDVYAGVVDAFKPTPATPHYVFNMRNLFKVFFGMLRASPEKMVHPEEWLLLWRHECAREFGDRLFAADAVPLQNLLDSVARDVFGKSVSVPPPDGDINAAPPPLLFAKFAHDDASYSRVRDLDSLRERVEAARTEYNSMHSSQLSVVMFDMALRHVVRLVRAIDQPRGHALLLGTPGGSGRKSLTRLAAALCDFDVFGIELRTKYARSDWLEDLRTLLKRAGADGEPTVFLFTETQAVDESFLEDIDNILHNGDVPNLFGPDDMEIISRAVTAHLQDTRGQSATVGLTREGVYQEFIARLNDNLHIVLCMSPSSAAFRRRLRDFPSLVTACTVDWFGPWPADALLAVGTETLTLVPFRLSETNDVVDAEASRMVNAVVRVAVAMHSSMVDLATQLGLFVTPSRFVEFLAFVSSAYTTKRSELKSSVDRFRKGLAQLGSVESLVSSLQEDLSTKLPVLDKTRAEVEALIETLTVNQAEAERTKTHVEAEELQAQKEQTVCEEMVERTETELSEALPELEAAKRALEELKPADIVEIRAMQHPPQGMTIAIEAVCILLGQRPKMVAGPRPGSKIPDYWPVARALMAEGFVKKLLGFDPEAISAATVARLEPYIRNPRFATAKMAKISVPCAKMTDWVTSMYKYYFVNERVKPLRAEAEAARVSLDETLARLAAARATLVQVEERIKSLTADYVAADERKSTLEAEVEMCKLKIERASQLTDGLADEKVRWNTRVAELVNEFGSQLGDILLASGVVVYLGEVGASERRARVEAWRAILDDEGLPLAPHWSVVSVFGDQLQVVDWQIKGLPRGPYSAENAVISQVCGRWPLLIDPQGQANTWLRAIANPEPTVADSPSDPPASADDSTADPTTVSATASADTVVGSNKQAKPAKSAKPDQQVHPQLMVVTPTDPHLVRTVEQAVVSGAILLMEDVRTELPAVLTALVRRDVVTKDGVQMVRLADKYVPYNRSFRMFMTSRLSGGFPPEVATQVTLVNFAVTRPGLYEQLLAVVVAKEARAVEARKTKIIRENAADRAALSALEDKILGLLASASGDILEDDILIETLQSSKKTSIDISRRLKEAAVAESEIDAARAQFTPVAQRGTVLYFVAAALGELDPMYQFSLRWFLNVYGGTIDVTPHIPGRDLGWRLVQLSDALTRAVYVNVCRSLFEVHKTLFSAHLAIALEGPDIPESEITFLLRGGGLVLEAETPKPDTGLDWLSDAAWISVVELNKLDAFHGILLSFTSAAESRHWESVYASLTPEREPFPGSWANLTDLQRMCVLRCIRPDKVTVALTAWVENKLGHEYVEPPTFSLASAFEDSRVNIPLIFMLSPGVDPLKELVSFGEEQGMAGDRVVTISLGQGQEARAVAEIEKGIDYGHWVVLQNCHLLLSWMPVLEKIVAELPDASGRVHSKFRLWLTSKPTPRFPVSILQIGVKIVNEAPRGVRANMRRSYLSFSGDDYLAPESRRDPVRLRLLWALSFFHALVQERRKYGPLGWNKAYEFSQADLMASKEQMYLLLDSNEGDVPLYALQYLTGEIMYGGRITDDFDRRTCGTLLTRLFSKHLLSGAFKFTSSGEYRPPNPGVLSDYLGRIDALPEYDAADVFGLHSNAEIAMEASMAENLFAGLDAVQRVYGNVMGGDEDTFDDGDGDEVAPTGPAPATTDDDPGLRPSASAVKVGGTASFGEVVAARVANLLDALPAKLDTAGIRAKYPFAYEDSMPTVLYHDAVRFNGLLDVVQTSLVDLAAALEGRIVMSSQLELVGSAVFDGRVPDLWGSAGYLSLKSLGSWMSDLQARVQTLQTWYETGPPLVFWLGGFFYPQAFLTGVLQNYARSHGVAIDKVRFKSTVMEPGFVPSAPPPDGAYIRGLFIEGAKWDPQSQSLVEQDDKVLLSSMPTIWLEPVQISAEDDRGLGDYVPGPDDNLYSCPVYKTLARYGEMSTAGQSNNFVLAIELPLSQDAAHWVLRSVACFLELKE